MTPDRKAEQQAWAELGREEQDRRLARLSRRIESSRPRNRPWDAERNLAIYTTYISTTRSLQDIGRDVGVSGERTRQVVARILRGLKHPEVTGAGRTRQIVARLHRGLRHPKGKSLVGDPT